uniref:CAZy families CBM48/GH13 protein n=1 Tax=uncultured Paludibacter sp. TaxID=497635 RepID=A0A060BWZ8_9BACT|nr:CAZy families CBM48/GH13 protein [uncultured Paludibacter sp.]
MKKLVSILFFISIIGGQVKSQMVTPTPAFPTTSGAVTIVFDASLMSGGLSTYTGTDVYVHTGVITGKSTSSTDWKYATTWLNNNPKYKLVSLGNKKWQFTISPDIRTFYGVPSSETVQN